MQIRGDKMDDKQYEKLKKEFVLDKDKDKIGNYRWDIGFLTNFKDKNNKQSFVDFINSMKERTFQNFFDKMVEIIDKEYIKITEIPTAKELFGFIKERIQDSEDSINYNKINIVKLKKEMQKEKDYDKIKKFESEIFWAEKIREESKKEIFFFNCLKDKMVWNIRYNKTKKLKNK